MCELILKFEPSEGISPGCAGFHDGAKIGLIQLIVCYSSNEQGDLLLAVKWDLRELIIWLIDNSRAISEEAIPECVRWNGSIFGSIEKFYDEVDIDQDEMIDRVFEYRRRHEICFGLRGLTVPSIYIGRGENGGEVSGEIDGRRFAFSIDIASFYSRFQTQFNIGGE